MVDQNSSREYLNKRLLVNRDIEESLYLGRVQIHSLRVFH